MNTTGELMAAGMMGTPRKNERNRRLAKQARATRFDALMGSDVYQSAVYADKQQMIIAVYDAIDAEFPLYPEVQS